MTSINLSDVQGFILRGYTMPVARYLGLSVREPAAAQAFLGALTGDDPDVPSVTSAEPWPMKPDRCINLGLTFSGLAALGVPTESLSSFPAEFTEGAAARAGVVGDAGPSAPEGWLPWVADPGLHFLVSIFAQSDEVLETATKQLEQAWSPGCVELGRHDGAMLPDGRVHFGYRDSLSQPTVEGLPPSGLPDRMPTVPPGAFLLGYPSPHPGLTYPVPQPAELGRNGSFAAFRVLAQDVAAFEKFLAEQAARTGMSAELLAAKLCGRWRNGTPLVLSPDTDTPEPPIPPRDLNDFDYVGEYDDERGLKCPVGSHIRRMYPRGQRVAGGGSHKHRIVRRGMPYGPPYDPNNPRDGHERGLIGLFIGVSLRDQFEFLMSEWANDGRFAAGLGRTKDPLIGAQDDGQGHFTIPREDGPVELEGFSRFVTTRGGAYVFLPSLTAIRYLATLTP